MVAREIKVLRNVIFFRFSLSIKFFFLISSRKKNFFLVMRENILLRFTRIFKLLISFIPWNIPVINFCMYFFSCTTLLLLFRFLTYIYIYEDLSLIAMHPLLSNRFKDPSQLHFPQISPAVSFYPFEVFNTDSPLIYTTYIFLPLIPSDMKKNRWCFFCLRGA